MKAGSNQTNNNASLLGLKGPGFDPRSNKTKEKFNEGKGQMHTRYYSGEHSPISNASPVAPGSSNKTFSSLVVRSFLFLF